MSVTSCTLTGMDDDSLATVIPFPRDRVPARSSAPEKSVEEHRRSEDYWALVQRLREERRRLATGSG